MVKFFSIFRLHLNSVSATFINIIYENSTVVLASVGLAQARPNRYIHNAYD